MYLPVANSKFHVMVNSTYFAGEEVLDHRADIAYDNGYSFGWGIRMVGVVGGVFGISILYFGGFALLLGPIFVLAGTFAATSWVGTEICFDTRAMRDFHSVFFRKQGKWISMDYFTDICILKLGKKQSGEDALGTEVNKVDMSRCEVFLMTRDHHRRQLVKACVNLEDAVQVAEFIGEKLGKPLVRFNPKVSSKTSNIR